MVGHVVLILASLLMIYEHFIDPTSLFCRYRFNLRLSDPQASIGCVLIDKLDSYVSNRQKAASRFIANIASSNFLSQHIRFQ